LNTCPSVPKPTNTCPTPGAAAISRARAMPSTLSMITLSRISPRGLSGHTSAFCLYCATGSPQYAAAVASPVSGRVPPADAKRTERMKSRTSCADSTSSSERFASPALSWRTTARFTASESACQIPTFDENGCVRTEAPAARISSR
jgi:hypothetical protein